MSTVTTILDENDEKVEDKKIKTSSDGNALEAELMEIESGGTGLKVQDGKLVDGEGNSWAIPLDQNEDYDDLFGEDQPIRIPGFHTQTIRADQVDEYQRKGFVLVKRTEAKLSAEELATFGKPTTGLLTVGPDFVVKIPKLIKDHADRRYHKKVREDLKALKPTVEMLRQSAARGFPVRAETKAVNHGEIEDAMKRGER